MTQDNTKVPRALLVDLKSSHFPLLKLIMIGDSGVGKSSLLIRFARQKTVTLKEHTNVKLQIWDTAGQERYRTIASAYYRGADGIILVYDVTNRESFEHVQDWIADVRQYARADIPIVLVGSKSDLETERVVQTTEGEQAAAEMKMKAEFVEASAKLSTNVDQVILMLARQVMVQRQPSKKNPSSGSKTLDLDGSSGKSSAFSKCCS